MTVHEHMRIVYGRLRHLCQQRSLHMRQQQMIAHVIYANSAHA